MWAACYNVTEQGLAAGPLMMTFGFRMSFALQMRLSAPIEAE
jgi:hypothetical protein